MGLLATSIVYSLSPKWANFLPSIWHLVALLASALGLAAVVGWIPSRKVRQQLQSTLVFLAMVLLFGLVFFTTFFYTGHGALALMQPMLFLGFLGMLFCIELRDCEKVSKLRWAFYFFVSFFFFFAFYSHLFAE